MSSLPTEDIDLEAVQPRLKAGHRVAEFSTCVDLDLQRHVVWDCNNYYLELGVPVNATRRQIREAYQRLGGPGSPRLTYIAKQLLNDEIRRKYDRTPLGRHFYDYYIETKMRDARVRMIHGLRVQRRDFEADILEDMFNKDDDPDKFLNEDLDNDPSQGEDGQPRQRFPWAYYLWGVEVTESEEAAAEAFMREWQILLLGALARKEVLKLAVGILHRGHRAPVEVRRVGYRTVVFLREGEPIIEELGEKALTRIRRNLNDHGHLTDLEELTQDA